MPKSILYLSFGFAFFSSLGLFGYDAAIDVRHLVSDAV